MDNYGPGSRAACAKISAFLLVAIQCRRFCHWYDDRSYRSGAYERTSLIVTTNLPFENWVEVMGNERLTGALLDRLTHRVHILEANGESYRLKEAKKRRKKSAKQKGN